VSLHCRYGPKQQPPIYTYLDGDANLFGARKPHLPQEFTLAPDELITKVELQWDPISMRCACLVDPVKWPMAFCPGAPASLVSAVLCTIPACGLQRELQHVS